MAQKFEDTDPRASPPQLRPEASPSPKRETALLGEVTSVTLTRKLAKVLDGVDLSAAAVGDRLDLPSRDAEVLIAEGWAERTPIRYMRRATDIRAEAADGPKRTRKRHSRR